MLLLTFIAFPSHVPLLSSSQDHLLALLLFLLIWIPYGSRSESPILVCPTSACLCFTQISDTRLEPMSHAGCWHWALKQLQSPVSQLLSPHPGPGGQRLCVAPQL